MAWNAVGKRNSCVAEKKAVKVAADHVKAWISRAASSPHPAGMGITETPASRPQLQFSPVDGDDGMKLDRMFRVENSLIEVNPGGVMMPPQYKDLGDRILDFEVLPDDVWLVSLPRTGSTWTQEMVWCIGNNLDFEKAKSVLLIERSPIIELTALMTNHNPELLEAMGDSVEVARRTASPRFIRSHLPYELLPTQLDVVKPKIVYVARNPKDMCVSYYHYCQLVHNLEGSFEDFCDLFLRDKVPIAPVANHILSFWERRHQDNILFLTYEEMKRDQQATIEKTAAFLGKSLRDEQIQKLAEHLSFESMQKNPAVNLDELMARKHGPGFVQPDNMRFIRKGQVGDWKNYLGGALAQRFDRYLDDHFRSTGLTF